jgi:hypothetical protein
VGDEVLKLKYNVRAGFKPTRGITKKHGNKTNILKKTNRAGNHDGRMNKPEKQVPTQHSIKILNLTFFLQTG